MLWEGAWAAGVSEARGHEDPSQQDLRKLEREIAASRDRLTDMVAELDRRRKKIADRTFRRKR